MCAYVISIIMLFDIILQIACTAIYAIFKDDKTPPFPKTEKVLAPQPSTSNTPKATMQAMMTKYKTGQEDILNDYLMKGLIFNVMTKAERLECKSYL